MALSFSSANSANGPGLDSAATSLTQLFSGYDLCLIDRCLKYPHNYDSCEVEIKKSDKTTIGFGLYLGDDEGNDGGNDFWVFMYLY